MAQLFISYNRDDRPFVDDFVPFLRRVYGNDAVWFDEEIHGGSHWWELILGEIAKSKVFIYILTNDSVKSTYCQAEFREALRLQKQILPVLARPRTDLSLLPDDLKEILNEIQYIDLTRGASKDSTAMNSVHAALYRLLQLIPISDPITYTPTPEPTIEDKTKATASKTVSKPKQSWRWVVVVVGIIAVVTFGIMLSGILGQDDDNPNPTLTPTISGIAQESTATDEVQPTSTETANVSPITPETDFPNQTSTSSQTDTSTNIPNTDTPTINAQATQTQNSKDMTATATHWTDSPTETFTPTKTNTSTYTYTPTPSQTRTQPPTNTPQPTSIPTNSPMLNIIELAQTPVSANENWKPQTKIFEGVLMVLVPAGCFTMGSDSNAYYWDRDAEVYYQGVPLGGRICFDEPFWIDRYEVNNLQFKQFKGFAGRSGNWTENGFPRESINWLEARAFCKERRGGRLPSEAEWEYAARGPNNLKYPWGNEFSSTMAVYNVNSDNQPNYVGSKPNGLSWVGAYDMSGNVWEWVNTIYQPYPYNALDGREISTDRTFVLQVLRGGSWLDDEWTMRSATRYANTMTYQSGNIGFRCARDFEE